MKLFLLALLTAPAVLPAVAILPPPNSSPQTHMEYERQNLLREQVEIQREMLREQQRQNSYYNQQRGR